MKKRKTGTYFLLLAAFAVFTVFAFAERYERYFWNNIPLMVAFDVILSLASAFIGVSFVWEKKTSAKIIGFISGFLFPNIFIWGLSMALKSILSNGGTGTAIGFISLFAAYLVIAIVSFFKASKTEKGTASKLTAYFMAGVMAAGVVVSAAPMKNTDTEEKYNEAVKATEIYENAFETAIPQTEIFGIVNDHFSSKLPEGKTEKKCVIIGFDGTRADIVSNYTENKKSAIKALIAENGHAYLSYCGGVQWPTENTQDTSTAPGWCSMITGCWADVHGIRKNNVPKALECKSLLLSLIESGRADSTKFCVSYDGHFNNEDSTYYPERMYAEENGLNASFLDEFDDNGTYKNTMDDIRKAECSDFLFCIFEECDHVGHQTNFGPGNFGYVDAFEKDDEFAYDIIEAIKGRETYNTEDWLIIITSDHGGYIDSHGGPSKQERYTFIISNKDIVA